MNKKSSKIRILMVLGNTRRGGTQSFVMNILRNIDRNKFQIDIAVVSDSKGGYGKEILSLGSKLILIPSFRVFNWSYYVKEWNKLLTNTLYDIVHGHSTNSAGIYLKVAKKHGCVTIAHVHSTGYRGSFIERLTKFFFSKLTKKYADYWFACTDKAAIKLYGKGYSSYENYYQIPDAIVTDKYEFNKSKRNKIRQLLNISESTFLCGHVGTFSKPKNHIFILDVFKEVHLLNPNSVLLLIGEGYLECSIKKYAIKLGIMDKIIFKKNITNVNEYMMAMDVFIFPSIFEGFGIVALESQATGLFTILSDVVPKDVYLTDCAQPMSLNLSAKEWADKAINHPINDRKSYNSIIRKSKYNLSNTIQFCTDLYTNMYIENNNK